MKVIRLMLAWFKHRAEQKRQAKTDRILKRRTARAYAQKVREKKNTALLAKTWVATAEPFVIADLETTGLSAATDEILEFAAILADSSGVIQGEFTTLVRIKRKVPSVITELTGITQKAVDRGGIPIAEAFGELLAFVGSRPVFFHNASFDTRFLKATAERLGLEFANPVHCTLGVARAVWPELSSHKLVVLAKHAGASAPTHRGLDDVKATLGVLLAAKELRAASPM